MGQGEAGHVLQRFRFTEGPVSAESQPPVFTERQRCTGLPCRQCGGFPDRVNFPNQKGKRYINFPPVRFDLIWGSKF